MASGQIDLTVVQPSQNQNIAVGIDFSVSGIAVTTGGPQPNSVVQVTVQLENGAPSDATLAQLHHSPLTVAFRATLRLGRVGQRKRQITVKAIDQTGASESVTVTVMAVLAGSPPCITGVVWENYARTQSLAPFPQTQPLIPHSTCIPQNLADIVAVVRQAEAANRHVHAVGSKWSFSDCAFTTDYVIDTTRLKSPIQTVQKALLPSQSQPVYHVEVGITIADLYIKLDDVGLALETMGGSSGQTLAGAISTGTHGGDKSKPPLADSVLAIHLVGAGGTQYWIEPSAGITDPQLLQIFVIPDIDAKNIIYDDATFDACLVSLGCMGVIYAAVLRVREAYDLVETTEATTWQDFLIKAPNLLKDSDRFLQVLLDPYTGSDNNNVCLLITRTEAPPNPDKRKPRPRGDLKGAIQDAIFSMPPKLTAEIVASGVLDSEDIGKIVQWLLTNAMPFGWRTLEAHYGNIMNAAWPPTPTGEPFQNTSWAVMDTTVDQAAVLSKPGYSVELFFPAFDTEGSLGFSKFVDDLITIVSAATETFLTGYVAMRFTGATRASLGMQQWDQNFSIEISVFQGVQGELDLITSILDLGYRNGGRAHWGQLIDLDSNLQRDATTYARYREWRQIYANLSDNFRIRTFENALSTLA